MDQGWSPELIAASAAASTRAREAAGWARVSHETIYQALYVQTRGGLRADLHRQLSLRRSDAQAPRRHRRPRQATLPRGVHDQPATRRGRRPCRARSLGRRPDHRAPTTRSAVGTLVERSTRFTILLHLPGRHDAASVAEAMIREMSKPARPPTPLDHLGPRQRARRLRRHPARTSTAGLLLRPALTLATRHQREHQPAAALLARARAPTSPSHTAARPRPDRRHPQRPTTPYPGPADPSPSAGCTARPTRQQHDRC